MEDARARAKKFLRGPCLLVPDKRSALLLELIEEYAESGTLEPDTLRNLRTCVEFAEDRARTSSHDAEVYFTRAATLLRDIDAELHAH